MPKVFVEPIGVTARPSPSRRTCSTRSCAPRSTSRPTAPAAAPAASASCAWAPGELTAPTERELKRIPEKLRAEGWRLACQAYPRSARVSIEVRGTAGHAPHPHHLQAAPTAPRIRPCVREVVAAASRRPWPTRAPTWSASTALSAASSVPLQRARSDCPRRCATASWRVTATCYGRRVIDVYPGERRPRAATASPSTSAPPRSSPTCSTCGAAR